MALRLLNKYFHSRVLWTRKQLSTFQKNDLKVAVIGAAGSIGQSLSLLLKYNPLVSTLCMQDISKSVHWIAKDLSHILTKSKIYSYCGPGELGEALKGANVVVIAAGRRLKKGMSDDDLFQPNAAIVYDIASNVARTAPDAVLAVVTNPLNSLVPVAAKAMREAGITNPHNVLGVTTLDLMRANTLVGKIKSTNPFLVDVPVIGGHSESTIIPLLSQCSPPLHFREKKDLEAFTNFLRTSGRQVMDAKADGDSAIISTAYGAARLVNSVMRGLKGEAGIVECAYVYSNITDAPYFSSPIILGAKGYQSNLGHGAISTYEMELVNDAVPILKQDCEKGFNYERHAKVQTTKAEEKYFKSRDRIVLTAKQNPANSKQTDV